jgi:alkylated DNA repair dioxygenase AlkB
VTGEQHEQLCEFLGALEPLEARYRGKSVKTRPKRVWALKDRRSGAFGLYKWGQEKADYPLVENMPELVKQLARKIEFVFGHPRGYINHAMATVYETGSSQYIPLHQDKAHSKEATGRVEDAAPIYNVSFMASRTFVLAGLEHAGKKDRKDFAAIREWLMGSGDLVVLKPEVNTALVHGVPREPAVDEKRVSLVFRHVTKHWIGREGDVWKTYTHHSDGRDSGWVALEAERVDTVEERVAKRRRAA